MRNFCVLLLLLIPCALMAQEPPEEVGNIKPILEPSITRPGADKQFWLMTGITAAATVFDIESTLASLKRGAKEGNPIMRPFVKMGRPAAYAFGAGIDGGIMYLSYRYKQRWVKKWWVMPLILASSQTVAGTCNLRFILR